MSHELEMVDGKAAMVYVGETPWHGLGYALKDAVSPKEMMKLSHTNWKVKLVRGYANIGGEQVALNHSALVRSSDNTILDEVTNDWKPVQNETAFDFFTEFCDAGDMTMETAGSLKHGQLVFALAKIKESFDLFKGKDQVDAYMLFTNPYKYGQSTSVSFTPIRVVCWNTLTLSLNTTKGDKIVKVSHRKDFITEQVKDALGVSKEKLKKYREMAKFLSTTKAKDEDIVTYFKRIFPVLTAKDESKKEVSKAAGICADILNTQPGAEFAAGTWWNGYNATTYYLDHLAGRTADTRLVSSWYGEARKKKVQALEIAVEMANAA